MAKVKLPKTRLTAGVVAAALTPIDGAGDANATLLADHCRRLLEAGCSSLVVLGTTGEANSFTLRERQALLEAVLAAGVPSATLIVGTGCCARGDTITLTQHALSLGIPRVLMLPPFYYKEVKDDGLFAAFAEAIEQIADTRLRVYLYRIPQITGIDISPDLIGRLLNAFPATLAGVKDSTRAWETTQALCARFADKLDILVGNETLLGRALDAGASGCVSATANVNAAAIVRLLAGRGDADAARRQHEIEATRAAFEAFGIIPALKAYLATTTGIEAWANVRAPLRPLSSSAHDQLMSRLRPNLNANTAI